MEIYKEASRKKTESGNDVESLVRNILADVREKGDSAVKIYSGKYDAVPFWGRVDRASFKKASNWVDKNTLKNLAFAAERVGVFAQKQRESLSELSFEISPGVTLGHRLLPVDSCGCYVPAGRYPLPSSALMSIIPAKAAGVRRIVACSPASDKNGIHPLVLAAMDLAGVDEVYCMGGAQAIAALAFGTETVEGVDLIVGPGNRYVTEAKRQVSGKVGIDMLAGPSEVLILADDSADPRWVAADLLARCEHDPSSLAVLATPSRALADAVTAEIEKELDGLKTAELAGQTWRENGRIVLIDSWDEGTALADGIAPEHLQVMTREPRKLAERLKNYGSLFIGHYAPVAFGDYVSGPNHILPTLTCARYTGGVGVKTFLRTLTWQEVTSEGADALSGPCAGLAEAEGLFGHRRSAELRGSRRQ